MQKRSSTCQNTLAPHMLHPCLHPLACTLLPRLHHRDYEAKSALDSYESAGLDNDVVEEGGYEEQLAARRMAEEAMEAADDRGRRGRKRALPGALEGE